MVSSFFKSFDTNLWILSNKSIDTNSYMSKYSEDVLKILSKEEIKSTNQILVELQDKVKKIINWHMLYRILNDLEKEGKIERLKAKAGFFWKKR